MNGKEWKEIIHEITRNLSKWGTVDYGVYSNLYAPFVKKKEKRWED